MKGAVAGDRNAMPVTAIREVIPDHLVLDATVIPEGHRISPPFETALKLHLFGVAVQIFQNGVAFRSAQLGYVRGKISVDVEGLTAGFRMGSDDRMLSAGNIH